MIFILACRQMEMFFGRYTLYTQQLDVRITHVAVREQLLKVLRRPHGTCIRLRLQILPVSIGGIRILLQMAAFDTQRSASFLLNKHTQMHKEPQHASSPLVQSPLL